MAKCTFCGIQLERGTGKMYVLKDGKVLYFCSSKCQNSQLKLNRKATSLKWTERYKKEE
jgi:large subunit ribosomal protein L24e